MIQYLQRRKVIMKEILLSFRPEYFKPLLCGVKKYEYRKRFCDEETKAYLYLSGKVRKVVGILELGRPIRLDLTRDNYVAHQETLKRVDKYIANRNINAVPVKSLSLFERPLSLEEIRMSIPKFMPPQMYFILDNHPMLKALLEKRTVKEKLYFNSHDTIYYDNLAKSVSELEKSEEFIKLYDKYRSLSNIELH